MHYSKFVRENRALDYVNMFGEAYAEDWVLFYDEENSKVHYINMSEKVEEPADRTVGTSMSYRLYTRSNSNFEELFIEDDQSRSNFINPKTPLKVITHGWFSSGDSHRFLAMKDAYLNKNDLNVVIVDWGSIANNIFYPWVAIRTKAVGQEVAKFLADINKIYDISYDQMHLIGHSLGAHVMGYAGSLSGGRVSRITGLDPARPMFEVPAMDNAYKLDPSDASFVDVIHTCGGILGTKNPIGHADFFPNSGFPVQPGCYGFQLMLEACSHSRASEYFAESIIHTEGFAAYRCESWESFLQRKCNTSDYAFMGDQLSSNTRGTFYLETNAEPSYSRGFA